MDQEEKEKSKHPFDTKAKEKSYNYEDSKEMINQQKIKETLEDKSEKIIQKEKHFTEQSKDNGKKIIIILLIIFVLMGIATISVSILLTSLRVQYQTQATLKQNNRTQKLQMNISNFMLAIQVAKQQMLPKNMSAPLLSTFSKAFPTFLTVYSEYDLQKCNSSHWKQITKGKIISQDTKSMIKIMENSNVFFCLPLYYKIDLTKTGYQKISNLIIKQIFQGQLLNYVDQKLLNISVVMSETSVKVDDGQVQNTFKLTHVNMPLKATVQGSTLKYIINIIPFKVTKKQEVIELGFETKVSENFLESHEESKNKNQTKKQMKIYVDDSQFILHFSIFDYLVKYESDIKFIFISIQAFLLVLIVVCFIKNRKKNNKQKYTKNDQKTLEQLINQFSNLDEQKNIEKQQQKQNYLESDKKSIFVHQISLKNMQVNNFWSLKKQIAKRMIIFLTQKLQSQNFDNLAIQIMSVLKNQKNSPERNMMELPLLRIKLKTIKQQVQNKLQMSENKEKPFLVFLDDFIPYKFQNKETIKTHEKRKEKALQIEEISQQSKFEPSSYSIKPEEIQSISGILRQDEQ